MNTQGTSPDYATASPEDRRRTFRETLAIGAAALAIALAAITGLWIATSASIQENYRQYLQGVAVSTAQLVDPVLHARIRDPSQLNQPDYQRAVEPLRRMRATVPDIRYVYTMVRDGNQVRFVLDAAEPGDLDRDGIEDQSGVWEIYKEREPAMLAALGIGPEPGVPSATDRPFSDKWGTFMTGWAPLKDANGHQFGALGVDVDASVYVARLEKVRRWAWFGVLPALALTALLMFAFYRVRLRYLAAKQRISASETRFRSLFELSPVGICLADMRTGRFLQVNDALVASTGYTREELLQRTYHDLTPPTWHAFERKQLAVLEHSNHFGTYEKEYQRKDGTCYSVLISGTRVKTPDGRELLWAIVQDISARKAMESELTDAARRDKLTGLANRAVFLEQLQRAVNAVRAGRQERLAVLFLDFDRFKLINDAMGHAAGDELLRDIAARLQRCIRQESRQGDASLTNVIARFGGDEFLLLLNDLDSCAAAEPVAARLLEELSKKYSVMGREVYSTASIGIVTSDQCLESAEAILRNADVAMYEAKRSGRACAVVFTETMHTRLTRSITIETCLRNALGTSELSLAFQPIVELSTGRIASMEALVRWTHPELGTMSPTEFIPVAEESGIIVPLGQWVLQEACNALARWRQQYPQSAPSTMSVNISRVELAQGDRLLERVQDALRSSGLPAGCLQLEVTEREIMRDPEATLRLMNSLRAMGVRLAMDDFGTGTSSLGCLRDYPFDVIKIDRSFVQDIPASTDVMAVIHATITLVENLGKTSVAEGVERAEQIAVLQSLGCQYAQGYYFNKPVAECDVLSVIANNVISEMAVAELVTQDAADTRRAAAEPDPQSDDAQRIA